jgi:hypothetical protein
MNVNLIRLLNATGIICTVVGAVVMLWNARNPETTVLDICNLNKYTRQAAGLVLFGAILQMIAVFLDS